MGQRDCNGTLVPALLALKGSVAVACVVQEEP